MERWYAGLIGYVFPSTLFLQLNDYEIRKGKKIGVTISFNNHRLFVGNIPKNRDRDDLLEEFAKHARKFLFQMSNINYFISVSTLFLFAIIVFTSFKTLVY